MLYSCPKRKGADVELTDAQKDTLDRMEKDDGEVRVVVVGCTPLAGELNLEYRRPFVLQPNGTIR